MEAPTLTRSHLERTTLVGSTGSHASPTILDSVQWVQPQVASVYTAASSVLANG